MKLLISTLFVFFTIQSNASVNQVNLYESTSKVPAYQGNVNQHLFDSLQKLKESKAQQKQADLQNQLLEEQLKQQKIVTTKMQNS